MDKFDLKITKQNWEPYYGNNHLRIERVEVTCGGDISFSKHLKLPLSQRLWEDLIHRLKITGLCIYRCNTSQWTISWFSGHCCIQLDENEQVEDITYVP